jgi:hypothetical protein
MKKETIEEVAERLVPNAGCELNNSEASYWQQGWISGHINGVTSQQEQAKKLYGEEEVLDLLFSLSVDNPNNITEWFVKFKKK